MLKRVFDFDMQLCPNCGAWELKNIAAMLELPVVERFLTHLGLEPPPMGRACTVGQDRRCLSRARRPCSASH